MTYEKVNHLQNFFYRDKDYNGSLYKCLLKIRVFPPRQFKYSIYFNPKLVEQINPNASSIVKYTLVGD